MYFGIELLPNGMYHRHHRTTFKYVYMCIVLLQCSGSTLSCCFTGVVTRAFLQKKDNVLAMTGEPTWLRLTIALQNMGQFSLSSMIIQDKQGALAYYNCITLQGRGQDFRKEGAKM